MSRKNIFCSHLFSPICINQLKIREMIRPTYRLTPHFINLLRYVTTVIKNYKGYRLISKSGSRIRNNCHYC